MSSFGPAVMAAVPPSEAAGAAGFPGLADYREQAQVLAGAGADLIALEMIGAAAGLSA